MCFFPAKVHSQLKRDSVHHLCMVLGKDLQVADAQEIYVSKGYYHPRKSVTIESLSAVAVVMC